MTKFVIYSSINQFFHYFIDSDIISYPSCLVTNNFIKNTIFWALFYEQFIFMSCYRLLIVDMLEQY